MVICLERGADLHMAQLMPLPLTVSCFSKIQIGFAFLVPAHLGSPGKGPLNGCVVRLGLGWRQVYCVYYSSWRALVQSSGQHGLTWHWHSSIRGLEVMTGRPSLHTRRCSGTNRYCYYNYYTPLTALFQGLPRILPKQETVSGSGIIWAICKSPPCSRQITTPAPHHPVFYRLDALPATQPTVSKH